MVQAKIHFSRLTGQEIAMDRLNGRSAAEERGCTIQDLLATE